MCVASKWSASRAADKGGGGGACSMIRQKPLNSETQEIKVLKETQEGRFSCRLTWNWMLCYVEKKILKITSGSSRRAGEIGVKWCAATSAVCPSSPSWFLLWFDGARSFIMSMFFHSCVHFHTAHHLLFNHSSALLAPLFHCSWLFSALRSSSESEASASLWGWNYNKRAPRMFWCRRNEWEVKHGANTILCTNPQWFLGCRFWHQDIHVKYDLCRGLFL